MRAPRDMIWIPSGDFLMGSSQHYPEEGPVREVQVEGFWIDRFQVTNAQFKRFTDITGYQTSAEKTPNADDYPGADLALLVPASIVFRSPPHRVDLRDHMQWWHYVPGADWRHPYGPASSIDGFAEHPVVHVSFDDVTAYAQWAGGELPTEAEWEYAAGAGATTEYAWGTELMPDGKHMANVWQGEFPLVNLTSDGYERTAPVGSFPPNAFGLHDMIGNVWEWTASPYDKPSTQGCCSGTDSSHRLPRKVMKGGSFLCAPNYCRRYRPAARMPQDTDTSTCHLGFRLIRRAPAP